MQSRRTASLGRSMYLLLTISLLAILSSGCVLMDDFDRPAPEPSNRYLSNRDSYSSTGPIVRANVRNADAREARPARGAYEIEAPDYGSSDSRSSESFGGPRAPRARVVQNPHRELDSAWGPGTGFGWLTGTITSKHRNLAVNVPLASWYVREPDRKGMGLLGGAIAYDMLTTHRVEGRPVTQRLTSFGLLGVAGRVDELQLDGSGGFRKSHWIFPFYRYENVNGERTLYPLFFFPMPLARDRRPYAAPTPEDAVGDGRWDDGGWDAGGWDDLGTRDRSRAATEQRFTLKSAPKPYHVPRPVVAEEEFAMENLDEWIRDVPTDESLPARTSKPAVSRVEGGWSRTPAREKTVSERSNRETKVRPAKIAVDEPVATPSTVRVQKGDTLSRIAAKHYGEKRAWKRIYEANRSVIANPNAIREGMILTLPE